jgi:hypothetical protein
VRRTFWLFPLLVAAVFAAAALRLAAADTSAQETDAQALCDRLAETALTTALTSCGELGRNEACYGHQMVDTRLRPNFNATFSTAGDVAPLGALERLSTSPFDSDAQEWGIAVLQAQANLPDALPGQNVTFLLYGDAAMENPTSDMRAVKLSTSLTTDIACADAPPSALLVQSPEGTQVTLTINGADIILGSTAYIIAEYPEMIIANVEGVVVVSAFGFIRVIQPGEQVFLPLDEELNAVGGPSEVEPYDCDDYRNAPYDLLPEEVTFFGCEGEATRTPTPVASATPRPSVPITATRRPGATLTPVFCVPRTDWRFYHIVQPGDTLSNIGQRIGVSPFLLAAGNCIADPDLIFVNQVLIVPAPVPPRPTPTVPTGPSHQNVPTVVAPNT